jgi:hypothetical protein
MAMNKPNELGSGVTVTYHRILRLTADFTGEKCLVQLQVGSYLHEAARRAGLDPVVTKDVTIEMPTEVTNLREAAYLALRAPVPTIQVPTPGFPPEALMFYTAPAHVALGFEESVAA